MIDYVGFNEFNLWGNTIEGRNYKDDFSGDQIIALYNALICSNIWESYEDFATTIEDQTKLAELLSDNTIGNQRVLMDRLIAYSLTGDDRFLVNDYQNNHNKGEFLWRRLYHPEYFKPK